MKKIILISALALIILISSCAKEIKEKPSQQSSPEQLNPRQDIPEEAQNAPLPQPEPLPPKQPPQQTQQPPSQPPPPQFTYSDEKLLFTNGHADPSVIKMPDGSYFMYLDKFGQKGSGYFVLTSKDAVEWKEKTGIIFPGVATGRAFLTDKGVRFYYPTPTPRSPSEPASNLISSFAEDGINFRKDNGVRIQPRQGYYISGPAIIRLKDGAYRMFFDESDIQSGNIQKAEIYGASSNDGLDWKRDEKPTIVAEDDVETGNIKQVLHPFVVEWQNGYLMLYNSHTRVFAAYSNDGFEWQKLGNTGLTGADVNAIALPDGSFRVYFGRFSEATSGEVYTAILKIE